MLTPDDEAPEQKLEIRKLLFFHKESCRLRIRLQASDQAILEAIVTGAETEPTTRSGHLLRGCYSFFKGKLADDADLERWHSLVLNCGVFTAYITSEGDEALLPSMFEALNDRYTHSLFDILVTRY